MKVKKRKYTKRTGSAAILQIQRIRSRNNKLWMQILSLAFTSKPRVARSLISKINENDKEISKWLSKV